MSGALLGVLLPSAGRALVLGLAVALALRLARMRDAAAETLIWTAVLLAALAMPVLTMPSLAAWLPGLSVALPALPNAIHAHASGAPAGGAPIWALVLSAAYGMVALALIGRLILGLVLTTRLYLRAEPVDQPWADGLSVRTSIEIAGPVTFAGAILLPADHWRWPRKKLDAVLAHERAHLKRGDFFIHLLASLHRALFWFNPFAWWLLARLSDLAEQASDTAAIRTIQDRAGYAEILMETFRAARRRRGMALLVSGPAMARGSGVAQRIEHILAGTPERVLAGPVRWTALAAVTAAALALAAVRAAPPAMADADPATARAMLLIKAVDRLAPADKPTPLATRRAGSRTAHARADANEPSSPPSAQSTPARSYDPRALIEDPDATMLPAVVAMSAGRVVLVPQMAKTGVPGE